MTSKETSQYWLMKSEPFVYSYDQLMKDKKTNWNGVRNFQARNFLKKAKKGDLVLYYHSNEGKAVVGIAKVVKEAYPDIATADENQGEWVQVDLAPVEKFSTPVTLEDIKKSAKLKDILLIKQSRLSVMPVSKPHFELIEKMGQASEAKSSSKK
jgi:predicted RNA-binding protein with PUA-like domain